MANKEPLYQSASKIDTYNSCSQLYSAKYLWKLPDEGNDGSRRGSVVHDVLELLLKPRHKKRYNDAIQHGTCTEVPALWKLVKRFGRSYGIFDETNLSTIDDFIMVALRHEFFGPVGTKEVFGEKEFNIQVDEDGKRYNIRGFIDQTFIVKDKEGLLIDVRDFKSSKAKFDADKVNDNIQSYMYQLALKHLYPQISRRKFHFLFLKFPRAPRQEQPSFTDEQLSGFEWRLTLIQEEMEKFTLENAMDNLAVNDADKRWLCGKEGLKKDGTKAWICGARNPMKYFVLLNENGEIIKSSMKDDLKPQEGQFVDERQYAGCPAYWNPTTGKRRNFA